MPAMRLLTIALALLLTTFAPAVVQAQDDPAALPPIDRSATGGATTLEDILRRQEGLKVDNAYRADETGNPADAAGLTDQLGTLGGASDPDLWRALRFNEADISTQARGPAARTLIQDSGMQWLQFRQGPLVTYGGYLLLGTLAVLALFYLIRGRIRIEGEKTGRKITRFKAVERMAHWILAGSFILLSLTGLITLMGRQFLIPVFGKDAFATLAIGSKWVHNNVSWAFMVALVMVFVMWVAHNLPHKSDLKWVAQGGGILGKGHPPAKKFNAGQKLIFWSVIVLGASVSASGLSLLFPFDLNLFAPTFAKLNAFGAPGWVGMAPLPTDLSPQAEMQLAQLWHAIIGFVMMAIILAHIYIGTLGMEGAYAAMGSGEVEEQWAREHHSLWAEEVAGPGKGHGTPAE